MSDVIFLLLTAVFFAGAWALANGCERLLGDTEGPAGDSTSRDGESSSVEGVRS